MHLIIHMRQTVNIYFELLLLYMHGWQPRSSGIIYYEIENEERNVISLLRIYLTHMIYVEYLNMWRQKS